MHMARDIGRAAWKPDAIERICEVNFVFSEGVQILSVRGRERVLESVVAIAHVSQLGGFVVAKR